MSELARLPELQQLEQLMQRYHAYMHCQQLAAVSYNNTQWPIYALRVGTASALAPAVVFVGGVHGLERIGSQVVLSYLASILARQCWERPLQNMLARTALYFVPIVNPVGMLLQRRSNGNRVDLMRNSASQASDKITPLVGGQRLSPYLPWYRGKANTMELESAALCGWVKNTLLQRPLSVLLDCHSGFGYHDRIWFPYARSATQYMADLGVVYRLREAFFSSFPHQNYLFEPQALHYCCHGDLWDECYDASLAQGGCFVPLTLEMGSWRWLKKNPLQIFSSLGLFHPMKTHRVQRVLRRHLVLMEFLFKAGDSWQGLLQAHQLAQATLTARKLWYQ